MRSLILLIILLALGMFILWSVPANASPVRHVENIEEDLDRFNPSEYRVKEIIVYENQSPYNEEGIELSGITGSKIRLDTILIEAEDLEILKEDLREEIIKAKKDVEDQTEEIEDMYDRPDRFFECLINNK